MLLMKIQPNMYTKLSVKERVHTVIYNSLALPLYGTMIYSLILWNNLMGILVIEGYVINPYNWCVTNKVIDVRK